jgi:Replication-relaxation
MGTGEGWYAGSRRMSNRVSLSPRDLSLLRLLSWTPATTALLLRASSAFDGGAFGDERRLRERLQALSGAGIVRSWATAHAGGGLENYYKLTPSGFAAVNGPDAARPPQAFFAEVSPSLFAHTFRLAEAIVVTFRACHDRQVSIKRFIRENELIFRVGHAQVQPDGFFRLASGGRAFNLALEIDNSTASVDSFAANSIRQKLTVYLAYQDQVLTQWLAAGKKWERPRFRVVFLTQSTERAYHILSLAEETTGNKSRRLVYAATHATFVTDSDPLFAPVFLDHYGHWQSLVDLHPTAVHLKKPVRLPKGVDAPLGI